MKVIITYVNVEGEKSICHRYDTIDESFDVFQRVNRMYANRGYRLYLEGSDEEIIKVWQNKEEKVEVEYEYC